MYRIGPENRMAIFAHWGMRILEAGTKLLTTERNESILPGKRRRLSIHNFASSIILVKVRASGRCFANDRRLRSHHQQSLGRCVCDSLVLIARGFDGVC